VLVLPVPARDDEQRAITEHDRFALLLVEPGQPASRACVVLSGWISLLHHSRAAGDFLKPDSRRPGPAAAHRDPLCASWLRLMLPDDQPERQGRVQTAGVGAGRPLALLAGESQAGSGRTGCSSAARSCTTADTHWPWRRSRPGPEPLDLKELKLDGVMDRLNLGIVGRLGYLQSPDAGSRPAPTGRHSDAWLSRCRCTRSPHRAARPHHVAGHHAGDTRP